MIKKIIIILLIIFVCFAMIFLIKSRKVTNNNPTDNYTADISIKSEYNEEKGIYEIYDEKGNLITTTENESEVEFYKKNPTFRESPPNSPNANL